MRKRHPSAYANIIPETYLTANEYDKQQFLTCYQANILKPPNLSCGRGIKIVMAANKPSLKLSKKKAYVAQRYIANPYLINQLKFDLRIYVLVTSYDPLRIYLYDDGLVRFCTEKYSTSQAGLANHYGHLTNYSVNKKNTAAFQPNMDTSEEDGGDSFESSKWTLQMLFSFIRQQKKESAGNILDKFQLELEDLIVKTLIAVESKVLMMTTSASGGNNGFELCGFDILLEGEELKPWLLEVNVFPSLSSSSPMDKRVKTVLVSDMFQLIGVPFQNPGTAVEQLEKEKKERLLGTVGSSSSLSSNTMRNKQKPSSNGLGATDKSKKKTVYDLAKSQSIMNDLDETDMRIIKEMEEEEHRRGHFKRIFPTTESWNLYGELFDSLRYKNVLCMRWLEHLATEHHPRRRSSSTSKK